MKELQIGKFRVPVPIVQGGMGIGISLGGLAGAVAKAGGIGIISAAQIGFRELDFAKNPLAANLRAMEQELKKARAIAPKGIIGFNIMVAMKHYAEYVKHAVEIGADLIVSGAGIPSELPQYAQGSDTCLAPIVSTNKSARVILKFWDRKYKRVPDMLVIEGPKAGGHLGFGTEELAAYTEESYDKEVIDIIDTVRTYEEKYEKKIPVVLAGGISDAEKAAHAFELGVDAIQVATRFVTTEECDADIRYKESYIQASEEDVTIVKSPVGMPGRAIRNNLMNRVMAGERIAPKHCYQCLEHCNPAEIPYCITDALVQAANGNTEDALLFCGADAYKAVRIETVQEVVDNLMSLCL